LGAWLGALRVDLLGLGGRLAWLGLRLLVHERVIATSWLLLKVVVDHFELGRAMRGPEAAGLSLMMLLLLDEE
jgi:hypothetical protein